MSNQWDERFSKQEYVYGTEPNAFVQAVLPDLPSSCEVLSLAEGEGRNAVYAAQLGHRVTAWDYSTVGFDKMHQLADSRNVKVKTELVDLTQEIDYKKQQWDVVLNVFGHIGDADSRKKLMNGIKEMLRPGGTYIMEVYSDQQLPYQSGGGNDIRLLYTPEEVLTVFADWHFKHFYYGEAVRHEGNLHTGLGHVIQTVVHKPIL